MKCPTWEQIALPFLRHISDGRVHKVSSCHQPVATALQLDEAALEERLSSGGSRYKNRVAWAKTHLLKAELLTQPKRGHIQISETGLHFLEKNPKGITDKLLRENFPVFIENWSTNESDNNGTSIEVTEPDADDSTPEDALDAAAKKLNKALADELLSQTLDMTPDFFEKLVVRLIVAMGYGGNLADAGKAIGRSGDEGIDGTIKEDQLGLDVIYIQAKRYKLENRVGRPDIQGFVGALQGKRARKGIFITTSDFSRDAKEYASNIDTKVILINGNTLARYMIDFDVGVTTESIYKVKRIDSDFFTED